MVQQIYILIFSHCLFYFIFLFFIFLHLYRFVLQSNIQLLLDHDIHNFAFHMLKLLVPSNLSTSLFGLKAIVLTASNGVVVDSSNIFIAYTHIYELINKISKENKSKCLCSVPLGLIPICCDN